jgi:hypothetical protein
VARLLQVLPQTHARDTRLSPSARRTPCGHPLLCGPVSHLHPRLHRKYIPALAPALPPPLQLFFLAKARIEKIYGRDTVSNAMLHINMAMTYLQLKKLDDAVAYIDVGACRVSGGASCSRLRVRACVRVRVSVCVAKFVCAYIRAAWAPPYVALDVIERSTSKENAIYATALNNKGVILSNRGKHGEAFPLFTRAYALRKKLLGANSKETAQAAISCGGALNW